MKTYSSRATAKRGAIREISKARGMTKDEVKTQADALFTIELHADLEGENFGKFFWRAVQVAKPAPVVKKQEELNLLSEQTVTATLDADKAEPAFEEGNSRRDPVFDKTGNVVKAQTMTEHSFGVKEEVEIKRVSTAARPTRLVWDIAEEMQGQRRKDVIQACVDKGIAYNTARTQFQQWYTAHRNDQQAAMMQQRTMTDTKQVPAVH